MKKQWTGVLLLAWSLAAVSAPRWGVTGKNPGTFESKGDAMIFRIPKQSKDSSSVFFCYFDGKKAVKFSGFKIRARALTPESVKKQVIFCLWGKGDARYWANFRLNSMEWQEEFIQFSGSPIPGCKARFSPEADPDSLAEVTSLQIFGTVHNAGAGGIEFALTTPVLSNGTEFSPAPPAGKAERKLKRDAPRSITPLDLPIRMDHHTRPVAKDGIFYQEGKPVFYLGANLSGVHPEQVRGRDKNKRLRELFHNDPIYLRMLNEKEYNALGMNSMELQPVTDTVLCFENPFPLHPVLQAGLRKYVTWASWGKPGKRAGVREKSIRSIYEAHTEQLKLLGGMPLIADFTQGFNSGALMLEQVKDSGLPKEGLEEINGWVTALSTPWCSSHPFGAPIENTYFKAVAYWMLKNGANPWVYELWNEMHYFNCTCEENQKRFLLFLKEKYGSLAALNREWNTQFRSYDEILRMHSYRGCRGLWADWMKFMGNLFQEAILRAAAEIRTVDKRPNTYITWQIANASVFYPTQGGDFYKGAQVVDVFGYEGGMRFVKNAGKKVGLLEEVLLGWGGQHSHKFFIDFCRALAPDKPLINLEMYRGNSAPATKNVFVTGLWNELIHGASSAQYYVWWMHPRIEPGKSAFAGYLKNSLLSPYDVPRKSLDGLKQFQEEFNRLAPYVAARPRIRGKVALLFSQPTVRQDPSVRSWKGQRWNVRDRVLNVYEAIHLSHYPTDVILEEHLREGRAEKYSAILVPGTEFAYQTTAPALQDFVRRGGTLIATGSAFLYDEYGKRLDDSILFGLSRSEFPEKQDDTLVLSSRKGLPKEISSDAAHSVQLKTARPLLSFRSGKCAVAENRIGKGRVYYVASENTSGAELIALYDTLLRRAGISLDTDVTAKNGSFAYNVELQLLDRGENQVHYLVNWTPLYSGMYLLTPSWKPSENGRWYVTDLISRKALLVNGRREWTERDLKQGILLLLPAQVRTLILVSSKPFKGTSGTISASDYHSQWMRLNQEEKKLREQEKERSESSRVPELALQTFSGVDQAQCVPLNLRSAANMGLIDEIDGDQKGGWLDQGDRDLRELLPGKRVLAGVPFEILNPVENHGKSCVMLRSAVRPYFAAKAEIPCGLKVKKLFFLHGGGWLSGEGEAARYIIRYQDHSATSVPVRIRQEIADWNGLYHLPGAKLAWKGKNPVFDRIGLYAVEWRNPFPEKTIRSIELLPSGKGEATVGILGVTAELNPIRKGKK